MIYYI